MIIGPFKLCVTLTLFATVVLPAASAEDRLAVRSDFEGASVRVLEIDRTSGTISFMPGGDPRRGWPCWWYFRIDHVPSDQSVSLRLQGSVAAVGKQKPLSAAWAMPRRAAWSADGIVWQQTPPGDRQGPWMVYQIPSGAKTIFVAWGPPFTPSMASDFVQEIARQHDFATPRILTTSSEGRDVPILRVAEGDRPVSERFGVWVQARQHAWESGSSWVASGFSGWVVSDHPDAAWLRQHAEIFVVPIMDVDNVATGNGGKNAQPHDHNRDWSDHPRWPEVSAAKRRLQTLIDDNRMTVFLDLHNPAPGDPTFFYVLPENLLSPAAVRRRDRFIDLAYRQISSIRPLVPMSNQPKQTGPKYHPLWKQISSNWVAMNGNPQTVSLCLETIWNSERSTTDGYQLVGSALARSVAQFLRTPTDQP